MGSERQQHSAGYLEIEIEIERERERLHGHSGAQDGEKRESDRE